MAHFIQICCLLILSICFTHVLQTQCISHTFHHLSVDEGLSSGQYNESIVDLDGVLMIGSLSGLNFFDGTHNRVIRVSEGTDSSGLFTARVPYGDFQLDRAGNCWFANGKGIIKYNLKRDSLLRFQPLFSVSGDTVNDYWRWVDLDTIFTDRLWAINDSSLLRMSTKKPLRPEIVISGHFSQRSRLLNRGKGSYDFFSLRRSKSFLHYYRIRNDRWDERRDRRITTEDGAILENILPDNDNNDRLWVATNQGLRKYDLVEERWYYESFVAEPRHLKVKHLAYADSNRQLIVTTYDEGVHLFDLVDRKYLGRFCDFQKGELLEFKPRITGLNIIGEHRIFLSTLRNGIYYTDLRKKKLNNLSIGNVSGWTNYKSIYRSQDSEQTYSLESKGVIIHQKDKPDEYWPLPISGEGVEKTMFVREDSRGRVWVGTLEWLFVKQPGSKRFLEVDLLPEELTTPPGYPAMTELPDGRLLFSTNEAEQFIVKADLSGSKWLRDGKTTHSAYSMAGDQLIVANARYNELQVYSLPGHGQPFVLDTTIATPEMPLTIRYDPRRNCHWLAILGRPLYVLSRLENGKYSLNIHPVKGLSSLMSLELDVAGRELWLSSSNGLFRYQPETKKLDDFHYSDGLQGTEFIWFSSFRDYEGYLYFGGANGVNAIDPAQVRSRIDLPRPTITDLVVKGVSNGLDQFSASGRINPRYLQQLTLPHDKNTVELRYSALEYSDPTFCRFRSRLVVNEDTTAVYSPATAIPERTLGPLAPGEYTLELLASNADGIWSKEPRRLHIVVEPPFWQEPWFIAFAALLLMALVAWRLMTYYRHRLYVKELQISEQNAYIEKEKALQDERDRLAKDMHDELGGGLTTIRLLLRKVKAKNPKLETGEELNRIDHHSSEIIKNMRFIVWALQRDNEQLDNFAAYLRHSIGGLLEDHDLEHGWRVSEELPDLLLTGTIRKNLWLCVKEATHNIIKHASADFVFYRIDWDDAEGLSISVTDNGVGIPDLSDKLFGYGLKNMRDRMESIGGSAEIRSVKGTTVSFQLPIATLLAT